MVPPASWTLPQNAAAVLGGSAGAAHAGAGERLVRRAMALFGARMLHPNAAWSRSPVQQAYFNRVVTTFASGFCAAAEVVSTADLIHRLNGIEPRYRGFAYEGAGMLLQALDLLMPGGARLARALHEAPGHIYLLHVGAGWALARAHALEGRPFHRLSPVLRWLAIDGAGFQASYLARSERSPRRVRAGLSINAARAFDQGLGRSLWFTTEAAPERIAGAIAQYGPERQGDLWSGVSLACTYAGSADDRLVEQVRREGRAFRTHLAQGAAFAAEAHIRGTGEAPAHTEVACRLFCEMPAADAARVARDTAVDLHDHGDRSSYEVWRARVRARFAA
jgi:hypothetical protein